MNSKKQTLEYIKTYKDLTTQHAINPWNPRDLAQQKIELVRNENGFEFALSREVVCKPDHREKFNELIGSLVTVKTETLQTVEGEKVSHKANFKVLNPARVTPKDNGTANSGVHIFLTANTRYHILCQIIEILGEENVDFSFPYFVDNSYDKDNAVVELLTAGYIDNTGITVSRDAGSQFQILDKAFDAQPEMQFEDFIQWVKNNLVYDQTSERVGSKQVHKSTLSRWVVIKSNPTVISAIEPYITLRYQSSFISNIFKKYVDRFETEAEFLTVLVELLKEFILNECKKDAKINTQQLFDKFSLKVDEYFAPVVTTTEGSVNDEIDPLVSVDIEQVDESIETLINKVQETSFVVLSFNFELLGENEQNKAKTLLARIQKQLEQLNKLTLPKDTQQEENTESLEVMAS